MKQEDFGPLFLTKSPITRMKVFFITYSEKGDLHYGNCADCIFVFNSRFGCQPPLHRPLQTIQTTLCDRNRSDHVMHGYLGEYEGFVWRCCYCNLLYTLFFNHSLPVNEPHLNRFSNLVCTRWTNKFSNASETKG